MFSFGSMGATGKVILCPTKSMSAVTVLYVTLFGCSLLLSLS